MTEATQEKGDLQAAFEAAIEVASKSHRKQEAAGLKQIEEEQQKQVELKQERTALDTDKLPINFDRIDTIDSQLAEIDKHIELVRDRLNLIRGDIQLLYTPRKHLISIGRVVQLVTRLGDEIRAHEILSKQPEVTRRKSLLAHMNSIKSGVNKLQLEMGIVGLPVTKMKKVAAEFVEGLDEVFTDIFPELKKSA